jgi:hypothetical protein
LWCGFLHDEGLPRPHRRHTSPLTSRWSANG